MYIYNLGYYFEEIVKQYSKNIALKFSKEDYITYEELNKKTNCIARYLLKHGIKNNDVVSISGYKTINTYACLLACLKIGAIYTIIDSDSPLERLKKIFSTCLPKLIFTNSDLKIKLKDLCNELNINIADFESEEFELEINSNNGDNLKETKKVTGSNPAYIMFTSGSTGFPKGAVITHQNVLNFISWSINSFGFTSYDILTNVNPLYFDNSVFDLYSSLFSGACLVPFSKEVVGEAKVLVSMIDDLQCTSWFSVPSLLIYLDTMRVFDSNNMAYIKRFIFGGEGYPKPKLKNLFNLYSDRSELINVYGPTECTCMCSFYKIVEKDFNSLQGLPTLGNIAGNFSYLILDDNDKKVQSNEIGELCLLGANVGMGYYNDFDKTKKSFVQNPYNNKYKEIMYRTGDLVKYNSVDGYLYFIGRKDNQIKHMGYRIEVEEIEAALNYLDYIFEAAVIHGQMKGLSQIIAVINTKSIIEEKKMRVDLKNIIPDYMIPTKFFIINDKLPKNANGKIDRRKLKELYLNN